MKNKNLVCIGISAVLVVAAFFAGRVYGTHARSASQLVDQYSTRTPGNSSRVGASPSPYMHGSMNRGAFGDAVVGQVIGKDATSITVSLTSGGSKIILYAPSTTVAKSAPGSIDDVAVGSNILVAGTQNPDGSVTASSIQIRPPLPRTAAQ